MTKDRSGSRGPPPTPITDRIRYDLGIPNMVRTVYLPGVISVQSTYLLPSPVPSEERRVEAEEGRTSRVSTHRDPEVPPPGFGSISTGQESTDPGRETLLKETSDTESRTPSGGRIRVSRPARPLRTDRVPGTDPNVSPNSRPASTSSHRPTRGSRPRLGGWGLKSKRVMMTPSLSCSRV